jgi:uncharacterized protein (DUF2141 family)
MPTGGPKDETPPELINATPANNQKNFSGKTIELDFNEDIKLKDPKEEILITPSVGKETKFIARKKKLTIEPQLPFSENTTYSINFREGVQDLTEGNPAENLRLAFSTGPSIDSLKVFGKVTETFSDKSPDKITVALYESDTFDIYKHTPVYFTKANKKGVYSIENLKAGKYFIYAFDDKNKNLKVDSKTEKFSFLSAPLFLPAEKSDSVILSLIQVDARPLTISAIRSTDKTTRIRLNKQVDSLKINNLKKADGIYSYGENKSEVIIYQAFPKSDSIRIKLTASDSVNQQIDTTFFLKYSVTKTAQETFKTKEINNTYDASKKIFTHTISLSKPILKILYDSIYLQYDSANIKKIKPDQILYDTVTGNITLNLPIEIIIPEKAKKAINPILHYKKGSFISLDNDSTRTTKIEISILNEDETGTLSVKLLTKETNYEVQLYDTQNKMIQKARNVKEYTFKYLKPQEYKIRVHIDTNNNSRWDPGNFKKRTEAEKIIIYKSEEGKTNIPIRANWEVGPLLIEF